MKRLFIVLLALLIAAPAIAGPPGWRPGAGKSMEIGSVAIGTTATVNGQTVAVTVPAKYILADNTARDAYFDGDPETPTDGLWIVSDSVFQRYETDTWVAYQTVMQGPTGAAGADGADGADGTNGADGDDGTLWWNGSGAPADGTGSDGDYYIDTTNHAYYGPKAAGTWTGIGPYSLQGPQGIQGEQGEPGTPGAGVSWEGEYNAGTTYAENDAVEYNGSSYIASGATTGDTPGVDAVWVLWVEKGDTGDTGAAGADGADGKSVLNGSGVPDSGAGVDGDFYIDTASSTIYGPKAAGAWGSGTSLVGPQGEQGIQGIQGEQGIQGVAGADGADGEDGSDAGPWTTGIGYSADAIVANSGTVYVCTNAHTAGSTTEPGVGASWATVWDVAGDGHDAVTIVTANGLSLAGQAISLAAATNSSAGAATAAQIQTLEAIDAKLPTCTPGDGDCGAEVPPNTLAVASWPAPTTGTNAGIRAFTGGRWYIYDISNTTWRLLTIAEDWDTWAEHPALTSAYFLLGNGSNQATAVQMSGDATMANDGAVTVANNAITAGKIADWYAYDVLPIGWAEDGTAAPDAIDDTTRDPLAYRTFAADSTEDVNFVWFVPSDLSGSTVQYRVKYLVTNATGPSNEGVAFAVAGVSAGDNDATNAAKGTAVTVTDTAITAAQHDILITDWSGDLTITALAAGEVAELSFNRDHDHASDDYGQVVGVLALEIRYVRNVSR